MISLMLLLTAIGAGHTAVPESANTCALLTPAEAAALGVAGEPMADGPTPDEDSGARRSTCVYQSGEVMLVVMVLEYPSAEAARSNLTEEMVQAQLEDEGAKVVLESGIGERAYWATTPSAGVYVVLRGPKVIAILLGGANFKPDNYQASLRKAAETALKRL